MGEQGIANEQDNHQGEEGGESVEQPPGKPDASQLMRDLTWDLRPDDTYTGNKTKSEKKEKSAIACYIAKRMIANGMTIFLDAGSTVRIIGRAIFARDVAEHLSLTIVTNNMDVLEDFRRLRDWLGYVSDAEGKLECKLNLDVQHVYQGSRLHLTGGVLDEEHHAFFGRLAAATLEDIWPDMVIMGTTGFCFDKGLFYHGGTEEEAIKEALYSKPVRHRIIAFDHTKLGHTDVFLCESKTVTGPASERGIGALSEGVSERVTIVTSAPDGKKPQELERVQKEIGKLNDVDSIVGRLRLSDKRTGEPGKLYLVQVISKDDDPYYDIVSDMKPKGVTE